MEKLERVANDCKIIAGQRRLVSGSNSLHFPRRNYHDVLYYSTSRVISGAVMSYSESNVSLAYGFAPYASFEWAALLFY